MRPSYFASCEPVIPGRAGDLWPRCVPPAPLILPFRPESNFHLSSTFPSPFPAVASPLPNLVVVVHAISCTYELATMGTNQFFSSPRAHLVEETLFLLLPFVLVEHTAKRLLEALIKQIVTTCDTSTKFDICMMQK